MGEDFCPLMFSLLVTSQGQVGWQGTSAWLQLPFCSTPMCHPQAEVSVAALGKWVGAWGRENSAYQEPFLHYGLEAPGAGLPEKQRAYIHFSKKIIYFHTEALCNFYHGGSV